MKEVVPGDSVNSLLSILDVITVSDQFGVARWLGFNTTPSGLGWRGPSLCYVPDAAGGSSRH